MGSLVYHYVDQSRVETQFKVIWWIFEGVEGGGGYVSTFTPKIKTKISQIRRLISSIKL